MSVLASSSFQCHCPNYWVPLVSLIHYTPSTGKKRCWAWLFQALLRISDEWHFIRSLQTRAQFILQHVNWLCIHSDFSGVTCIYIAEEGSLLTSTNGLTLFNLFVENLFWDYYISQGRRPFKEIQMITRADQNEVERSAAGRYVSQNGKLGNAGWCGHPVLSWPIYT